MEKGTDDSGWLRTRSRKGKRKRDADESCSDGDENHAADSQSFSQDVVRKSDMPPPPPRRKAITSETSPEPKSRKRRRLADEVSASSREDPATHEGVKMVEDGGRSALARPDSEEVLRFIEHYLVAVGNLMGSIRHLLLADDEQLASFNKAYQHLRGVKEDIVSRMAKMTRFTGYELFKAERAFQIHEENPTSNMTQLTAILRAQWKALSNREREKYTLAAKVLISHSRRSGRLAIWRLTSVAPQKRAKEEGLVPCNGPGWTEFVAELKAKHQEEGLSRTELLRIAKADWTNLSQEERDKYIHLARVRFISASPARA